jgi:hypothetical protein
MKPAGEPDAGNPQSGSGTIRKDRAENSAPSSKNTKQKNGRNNRPAENSVPASGEQAARIVERANTKASAENFEPVDATTQRQTGTPRTPRSNGGINGQTPSPRLRMVLSQWRIDPDGSLSRESRR